MVLQSDLLVMEHLKLFWQRVNIVSCRTDVFEAWPECRQYS